MTKAWPGVTLPKGPEDWPAESIRRPISGAQKDLGGKNIGQSRRGTSIHTSRTYSPKGQKESNSKAPDTLRLGDATLRGLSATGVA